MQMSKLEVRLVSLTRSVADRTSLRVDAFYSCSSFTAIYSKISLSLVYTMGNKMCGKKEEMTGILFET